MKIGQGRENAKTFLKENNDVLIKVTKSQVVYGTWNRK